MAQKRHFKKIFAQKVEMLESPQMFSIVPNIIFYHFRSDQRDLITLSGQNSQISDQFWSKIGQFLAVFGHFDLLNVARSAWSDLK